MGFIIDILKLAGKGLLFGVLVASVGVFINFLMGLVPPIALNGCIGYWVDLLGIFLGIQITVSIVIYAFTFKFALSFFAKFLD